jgi:hypothetical protein
MMSYMSFDFAAQRSTPHIEAEADCGDIPAGFSALEQQVIEIARRDGVNSLGAPTWIHKIMRVLFGIERPPPLANPDLERLRQAVVKSTLSGN